MKKIFLLLVFAALVPDAGAQGIQRTRTSLNSPGMYNSARVVVTEDADAARAINAADNVAKRAKVMGYRVSLFRDNNQTAGENARSVAALFREQYPEIPVQVEYHSPYFSVTAGNFVDKVDAIALCGKVLPNFKKAVVTQQEVSIAEIISQQKSGSVNTFETESMAD